MFTAKMFNPTTGSLTAVINGKSYSVGKDHASYRSLLEDFQSNNSDGFIKNLEIENVVKKFYAERSDENEDGVAVEIKDDVVVVHNSNGSEHELSSNFSQLVIDNVRSNKYIESQWLLNFFANMLTNPSSASVQEGFDFLKHKNMPITPDGHFLAYKTVKEDFTDKYSGKVDNSVGAVVEMPRNQVDDNRGNECSYGYHVGALSYAGPGGWYNSDEDNVMIVKINPRDIVSVPEDHNATKMRVCRYEVVELFHKALPDDYSEEVEYEDEYHYYPLSRNNIHAEMSIAFDYDKNNNGHYEERFLVVEDIHSEHVVGELLHPEVNAGQIRSFSLDKIYNLEEAVKL